MLGSDIPYASEAAALTAYPNSQVLNTTRVWEWACFVASLSYAFALFGTIGYLWEQPGKPWLGKAGEWIEYISRYITYLVFFAMHCLVFSHSGIVCTGNAKDTDGNYIYENPAYADNIMVAKGRFFIVYIIASWFVLPLVLLPVICIQGKHAGSFALKHAY